MNTTLRQYGIFEDKSDLHVHVSFKTGYAYAFKTKEAVTLCKANPYRSVSAYQRVGFRKIETARGFLVPVEDFTSLQEIKIPKDILKVFKLTENSDESMKGNLATVVTKELLKAGLLKLPIRVQEITDKKLQVKGMDIVVISSLNIQVKCDYRSGRKKYGGTGNLFIQTHECNPYKKH